MASALGKISAILTANTSQYQKSLDQSAQATRAFGRSVTGTINAAAKQSSRSFDSILTPLQKLTRALDAAGGTRLRLTEKLKEIGSGAAQIARVAVAAEQLARPFGDSVKQFGNLSQAVQAQFLPALRDAQRGIQQVQQQLSTPSGDARFLSDLDRRLERVTARAERTREAISRLSQAQTVSQGLATGRELQFTDPTFRQRLVAASEASSRAIGSSAETISANPQIAQLTQQLRDAVNFSTQLQANLENARLGGLNSDIEAAERRLAQASETVRRITTQLNAATAAPALAAASSRLNVLSQQDLADDARRRNARDRAQFASQFLQVDQRESDLIANQGLATDVRDRVRLLAEVQQREREFAEAREDAARRAEAASRFLVVDQLGSEIASNQGARTDLQPGTLQQSAERTAAQQVGAGVDTTIRQLDQLAQRVQGVRGQIDSLPATIGTEFIPQLQRAEQEFIRLRASGRATAEEIENASNNVEQLAAQVRRVGAAQGLGSFADGLDDTALRGAIGSLQALQQILNRVGATAGSDAAKQFDRMRAAIQRATREGTIGSEAFQRELRQLSQEAANAAAATGKIGRSAAFREIQRGGDIARGGFDKLSLATQQAAFAIDDFFSATGDFTQKIRAVQNNVTQLAFILGGTTGLFIGLGVAIAAQAAVALFKFFNETEKASLGAEYLNEALQKQKTLAEETAEAFRELGDSVAAAGSGFAANRDSFQINEEVRQRSERRQQQAEQFVLQTDPRVIQAEAEVRRLEKELEEADDRVDRVRVSARLGRARRDLQLTRNAVLAGARSGAGFDGEAARESLQRARDVEQGVLRQQVDERRDILGLNQERDRRERARLSNLESVGAATPESAADAAQLVREEIARLDDALSGLNFFDRLFTDRDEQLREEIGRLGQELGRLEFEAASNINEVFERIDRTAAVAQREVEATLQGLADIGTDIDITGPLADQIAEQTQSLRNAQRDAQNAAARRDIDGVAAAEDAARRAAEELEKTYAQIDALARDVALGAEVSIGQRLGAALEEVGNLGPSVVETSIRRAQAELDQLNRERTRATISDDTARVAEIDAEIEALRQQTAGLEESAIALRTFQSAVEEAALALVDTLVSEAKRAADQARRNANQAVGEGRFDAADAQAQSAQARQRQRELEQQRLELDNQVAQARLDFEENNPAGRDLARRIREGRQRANDATLTAQQREAARADAAIAQAELDDRVRNLPAVRAAQAEADRQDQQRFREQAAARQSRERASGRAAGLDREFDTFRRIASDLGDIEQLRSLQTLEQNIADVRAAIKAAADAQADASDSVKAELDRLEREAERTRNRLLEDSIRAEQDVLGGFEAQTRAAERELSQSGVGISAVQGDLVRARQRRQSLVAQRDAITGEDDASQNRRERLQQEIDAIDEWSAELNASAIAVAGFQDALNEAALSLQNTVTSERERAAEQSRRQANEAEAVFGKDSPLAKEARNRAVRDEQAARDAQAQQREAEREIGRERAKFEQELAANPGSEAAQRAERIREQEQIAADQARSTAEREAARAEARRLRAEQQAEFEQRPGVQAARRQADEADIALQQRQSADRAFERSRTERQRQEREAAQIAGDLRNRFTLDNVNPLQQQQEVNQTVRNEAGRIAPLLTGFAEQRQNAILQGPSRAALQVQDVTTTQGRNELNRLLRGDDSARDVNLVELKKQTSALQQVITAIEKATGVVATVDS